jgi:hypothetical protein
MLKTFPLELEVLTYNIIDIGKETANNLPGNILFNLWLSLPMTLMLLLYPITSRVTEA